MISNKAIAVLQNATIEPERVTLNSGQLEREIYTEVDEVLKRLGGKWKGNKKAHLFSNDPQSLIAAVIETKEMPPKNPTAFFPTPKLLAEEMLRLADFSDLSEYENFDFRILEPEAGVGGIADVIRAAAPEARIDTVECLPLNQRVLQDKGYEPYCGDFMEFNTDYVIKYDYIFMNPPFSLDHDKKAYITHVEHAYNMLKETGTLAAILPVGFISNSQKKEHDFLKKVLLSGSYYKHEKGSFKEFGTMVDTCTVVMNKDCSWKYNEHYSGHKNYFIWLFGMYTNNEEPLMRQKEKLFASNPNDEAYLEYINLIIDNAEKKGDGLDTELIPDYMAYLKRDYADEYGEDEVCEPAVEHSAEKESYVSAHKQAEIITNGGNLFDIMNVA